LQAFKQSLEWRCWNLGTRKELNPQYHAHICVRFFGPLYAEGGPAVSQSSRRFKQRILEEKKLKKIVGKIAREMDLVEG